MTNKRLGRRALLGVVSGAVLLAAGAGVARADVKIGVFAPLTGNAAGYGQSLREAIELAVREKNEAGGVLGQKINLVVLDDAGKPEQGVNVAKRLANSEEVLVMLGSVPSPVSFAASQVALQTETPHFVVNSTAQRITTQGNPWVFRSSIPDTKLASDLADFLAEKYPGKKKIAFLYVNDDLGKGGYDAFTLRAQKIGLQIVVAEKYAGGDLDFTSQLSKIRDSGADIFIDWSRYVEGALIAKQARQMGIGMVHVGAEGLAHPKFIELAGEAAEGIMYETHFSLATAEGNKAGEALVTKIRAAYGKDPDFTHALAYDAITATFLAIEKAGSTTDRVKFRDALKTLQFDSTRGRFSFDQKGDPTLRPNIVMIKNGKEVSVTPTGN